MQHLFCPLRDLPCFHQNSSHSKPGEVLAYHRIKPHAPPLVRTPVNSFEFHPCGRTPQVANLSHLLGCSALRSNIERASFRAWTTRVSNPVRSPTLSCLSVKSRSIHAAFAIGIPMAYQCISPLLATVPQPPNPSRRYQQSHS